ncbi:MAG: hypothetical protein ABI680_05735, partial [Chthoniobacteraceae bacterium]
RRPARTTAHEIVPLPLFHDKIQPTWSRRQRVAGGFSLLACTLLAAAAFATLCGALSTPLRPTTAKDRGMSVLAILLFGAGAFFEARDLFPKVVRFGRDRVILDEDGVHHPHHRRLVPWRDIISAALSTAEKTVHGPTVAMMNFRLIDDQERYPRPYDIHASPGEEYAHPAMIRFTLELSPLRPEVVLAFAKARIQAARGG